MESFFFAWHGRCSELKYKKLVLGCVWYDLVSLSGCYFRVGLIGYSNRVFSFRRPPSRSLGNATRVIGCDVC